MDTTPSPRWSRFLTAIEGLAASRWQLFCILFMLDALVQPYAGVRHDAQLYAVQVLNHLEGGRFNGDLFFQYGSQDSYSLFSLIMAPVAKLLGVLPSFFLVYLLGRGLFLYGALRLVRALVPDAKAGVIALIFLAVSQIPYAGRSVFHVNERFLTPRLLATGLVLLGLEQMLLRKTVRASGLMILALLLHPLIAFGGLLIFLFWRSFQVLALRYLVGAGIVVAFAAAMVLFDQPLGLRLFGAMDEHWRDLIFRRSPHCFPAAWLMVDWLRIGSAFLILAAVAPYLPRTAALFCWATIIAGLLGLVGAALAAQMPYALLLQGQPFRVLWIVQFAAIPLGCFLVFRWAADDRPMMRMLALLLGTGLLCQFAFDRRTMAILLVSLPLWSLACWWLADNNSSAWLRHGLLASVFTCLALGFLLTIASVITVSPNLLKEIEPMQLAGALPGLADKGLLLLTGTLLACWAWRRFGGRVRTALVFALIGLVYQGLHFGAEQSEWYCRTFRKGFASMRFLEELMAREGPRGRPPTIYWTVDVKFLWLYLRAHCYFHLAQTPNNIFSRGEAIEGDRRARLVSRFEIQHMRAWRIPGQEQMSDDEWRYLLGNFYASGAEPDPQAEDLARLREEDKLDYVVSNVYLGPNYRATNGAVYVYETRAAEQARTRPDLSISAHITSGVNAKR